MHARAHSLLLALLLLIAAPVYSQKADEPIDFDKARALIQRERAGEKLTDEERAYLQRAREARQRAAGGNLQPKESTGLIPLTDLGDGKYKDQDGGLYGKGSNTPPEEHLKLALAEAAKVVPLDKDGKPAPDGKIVLMSIGMSNTTQEFSRFVQLARAEKGLSTKLVIVDSAQGGRDAPAWANTDGPWETALKRMTASGVTPQQVQAVWLKQAQIAPGQIGDMPKHTDKLQADIRKIILRAKTDYPNLKLVYLSSRIYAGYASTPLNPEPFAYESAFAVRGLIQEQMSGKGDLAKGPVLLWGPYLWADGTKGRKAGDLTYAREDLAGDGTHPSNAGREKVAKLLLEFFKTDATSKGWFVEK